MGALLDRFSGPENSDRLVEAVSSQAMVANDVDLANQIIAAGELQELEPDTVIITQGDWDDDLFFILAGQLQIVINGRPQAIREAGTHVGELTGTAPARARTAEDPSDPVWPQPPQRPRRLPHGLQLAYSHLRGSHASAWRQLPACL